MNYNIIFEPLGKRICCQRGAVIFEVARDAGVGMASICGGKGICGKCKIRILSGQVSPLEERERKHLSPEEIAQGYRLACQIKVCESVRVEILPESHLISQRLLLAGKELEIAVEPVVDAYYVSFSPASLVDNRSDQARILDSLSENHGLKNITIDLPLQRQLPILLRTNESQIKIGLRGREMVMAGNIGDRLLGLAVDLGTTKVTAYLTDLETGEVLLAKGTINPQIAYGEDLMSRLTYAIEYGGEILKQMVVRNLNILIEELCTDGGFNSNDIVELVIVGNTAMHHLFLGLPVRQLALAPYVPAVSSSVDIKAREMGLIAAPSAYIHILPNIAGFVGADHVAMLLATGFYDTDKIMLGLDIGTNTEITLASHGILRACSCASGPAFEGAHIKDGMRATAGAIERVRINSSSVDFQTIDNKLPIGLCGSGILDAVAQLLEAGIIDEMGRLQSHPRVRHSKDGQKFILVPKEQSGNRRDITLTQKDIGEIQLAKGAIAAGASILLAEARIGWEEIDEVIIAGAFGNYLDVASAIQIGMLPSLPVKRFSQVGNAAGVGAKMALVSKRQRALAEKIVQKVEYIELTNHTQFPRIFAHALRFRRFQS